MAAKNKVLALDGEKDLSALSNKQGSGAGLGNDKGIRAFGLCDSALTMERIQQADR